jgi:hypothetical protein
VAGEITPVFLQFQSKNVERVLVWQVLAIVVYSSMRIPYNTAFRPQSTVICSIPHVFFSFGRGILCEQLIVATMYGL